VRPPLNGTIVGLTAEARGPSLTMTGVRYLSLTGDHASYNVTEIGRHVPISRRVLDSTRGV